MKKIKLRSLDKLFTQSQQQILDVNSKNTVCYRGQYYNPHIPPVSSLRSPQSLISAVICKYRGVSYVVERHQFPT